MGAEAAGIRRTVKEFPKQKIVGICWGHQTICVAFGGTVRKMAAAEIGVTPIQLTDDGLKMFPIANGRQMRIHEFHAREIAFPAKGFQPLANGNQSFLSETNTILKFQGDPEMNGILVKVLLASFPTYTGVDEKQKETSKKQMDVVRNGAYIWERILAWVMERIFA